MPGRKGLFAVACVHVEYPAASQVENPAMDPKPVLPGRPLNFRQLQDVLTLRADIVFNQSIASIRFVGNGLQFDRVPSID